MSNDETPAIPWGTASLKSGFTGIIRKSVIQVSEKSFDDKPPADQLYWEIEPTDSEVDEEKWPKAWYNISHSSKSKWAKLQARLEELKILPKKDASELEGLEIEFERVDLKFGKDKEGNQMVSEDVLMPKKLVRDHRKSGGKEKTKGSSDPAPSPPDEDEESAPSPDSIPESNLVCRAPKEKGIDVDIDMLILDAVAEQPLVLADFYRMMNKKHHITRTDVFRRIMALKNEGKVKLDTEGRMLVKVDEATEE